MDEFDKWLLPEGIDEVLPQEAIRLEGIRRRILDLFASWGYRIIISPLAEHLESFLLDDKDDLQIQTFKLTDQLSGRMLGVRPDMTPQIARMDAHSLRENSINRLCYVGQTLNTRPSGAGQSRSPLQIGAEIYGHKGVGSNAEALRLMIEMFRALEVEDAHIVLGHVGIYSALTERAALDARQRQRLTDLMRTKSKKEAQSYLAACEISQENRRLLVDLIDFYGELSLLPEARRRYAGIAPAIDMSLDEIDLTAKMIASDGITVHCDFLEAPGYHYEDGLVFAAFTSGIGQEIARGGRYDGIGKVFGRARPGIGFSSDLKLLARVAGGDKGSAGNETLVYAPLDADANLAAKISHMRRSGERVIIQLDDDDRPDKHGCTHILCQENGGWRVKAL